MLCIEQHVSLSSMPFIVLQLWGCDAFSSIGGTHETKNINNTLVVINCLKSSKTESKSTEMYFHYI